MAPMLMNIFANWEHELKPEKVKLYKGNTREYNVRTISVNEPLL
jgi:hypothetical protein